MKTNIKPIINQVLKNKLLIIERYQNNYYISDSFIIIKVCENLYEDSVKKLSELFITLNEMQSVKYFNKKKQYNTIKLKELYDRYDGLLESGCYITPFLYKCKDTNIIVRIIKKNNTFYLFDNNKIESALKLNTSFITIKNEYNIIFFNRQDISVGILGLVKKGMFDSDFEKLKIKEKL